MPPGRLIHTRREARFPGRRHPIAAPFSGGDCFADRKSFVQDALQPARALAAVRGSADYPTIRGQVRFYQARRGVLVTVDLSGLPQPEGACAHPVFALHIHAGEACTGTAADPFANALSHYNPKDCLHPFHAGDLPPLFGNDGDAFMAVLTNRFTIEEVVGRTVILHSGRDDFTTQPAGDAGKKIACGVIRQAI